MQTSCKRVHIIPGYWAWVDGLYQSNHSSFFKEWDCSLEVCQEYLGSFFLANSFHLFSRHDVQLSGFSDEQYSKDLVRLDMNFSSSPFLPPWPRFSPGSAFSNTFNTSWYLASNQVYCTLLVQDHVCLWWQQAPPSLCRRGRHTQLP